MRMANAYVYLDAARVISIDGSRGAPWTEVMTSICETVTAASPQEQRIPILQQAYDDVAFALGVLGAVSLACIGGGRKKHALRVLDEHYVAGAANAAVEAVSDSLGAAAVASPTLRMDTE